jgi:phosphoserine phosphatase
MFALDRVRVFAPQHPESQHKQPFKAVIAGDRQAMSKFGEADWLAIVGAHTRRRKHRAVPRHRQTVVGDGERPRWKRPYTELVYQPMLEVLEYLRTNGFQTYIISGGGQEFIRAYAQRVSAQDRNDTRRAK